MIRLLFIASALLLAHPALSADDTGAAKTTKTQKSQKAAKKGKAGKDDKSADANKPAASLKPGVAERFGKKRSDEHVGGPTAEQKAAVQRARNVYKYAVESCDRPEKCDAALRDDAEQRFMDACRDCTTMARCEQERDAIKEGRAPGGPANVCGDGKK